MPLHNHSPPTAKIALFRTLFQGRTDVFPTRFESTRTGRTGYTPACANEWAPGICQKPRIKCADCAHRAFHAVTDDVIRHHLSGRDAQGKPFIAGVYPMLLDDTCHFLAIDFDKTTWQQDVLAVLETCETLRMPAALERSRSGNGGHIWLFFAQPVPATLARKLGSHILTETMEQRPELGLASYDRLFPNQDILPKGGFGNLIALPLQKAARDHGNSLFIDPAAFTPWPDQWAFLSDIPRLTTPQLESQTREAESRGRITGIRFTPSAEGDDPSASEPWNAPPSRRTREAPIQGPLPKSIDLILGDQIYIPKENLPAPLRIRLIRLAAFQNPEFYRAQAMRLSTWGKPRIISCAEDTSAHIGLPRGCLEEIQRLLKTHKINARLRDERHSGTPLETTFTGTLRPDQQTAAAALLAHDTGTLSATTAFGKTVLAAHLIAARQTNTLILVHRKQLLEQWVDRLATFLDIPAKSIGRLGGGCRKLTGKLDVALIQSLVRKGVVNDAVANYGHLVIDECHHLSAQSFELVARRAKAKFVLGLSATVTRKDGHHPIITMQCGPIRHRVDAREQAEARPFSHHVIVRPTGFRTLAESTDDARVAYQNLCQELVHCDPRNHLIRDDVLAAVNEGRSPLILTERTEHIDILAKLLQPHAPHLITLRGGMSRKALRQSLEQLETIPEAEPRIILATGKFIGEGFDDPRLDTLFLTLPVSWRGIIAQYAGRLHRLHDGKREVRVHDYADLDVLMLARMFDKRCVGYESIGYTILLPASALPGWPVEVPLPIDPTWKNDHAASIRRLIRDGVDVPLAGLFLQAANPPPDEPRARSAAEAFLYHRLESIPETAGLFQLNAKLPIPFDNWSEMEIDLYCPTLRLAIEIDGSQHLGDPAAYRRDRRKDALLQQRRHHILRFLARDLSGNLDATLDAIHRALAHLRPRA